jgi:hypothetical protein
MKKFNRQEFNENANQIDFNMFLGDCILSIEGRDGFYTRKDAFKTGVMVAYSRLKNDTVSLSDYESLERQDELNRAKIRQLESQLLAKSHI